MIQNVGSNGVYHTEFPGLMSILKTYLLKINEPFYQKSRQFDTCTLIWGIFEYLFHNYLCSLQFVTHDLSQSAFSGKTLVQLNKLYGSDDEDGYVRVVTI